MLKFRKYIAIGGTVYALAIGFVMQFGRDVPSAESQSCVGRHCDRAERSPHRS